MSTITFPSYLTAILASASTTRPAETQIPVPLTIMLIALTIASPFVAWKGGLLRPLGVRGPTRLLPGDRLGNFLLIFILGLGAMIIGASIANPIFAGVPPEQREFTVGIVGEFLAFLAIIAGTHALRRDGLRRMGLSTSGILPGLGTAIIALLVVFPWLFWIAQAALWILKLYHVEVPTEHPIFQTWKEPQTGITFRVTVFLAATLLAPIFEETAFRGLIQTALSLLFTPRTQRAQPPPSGAAPGMIIAPPPSSPPPAPPSPDQPPVARPITEPSAPVILPYEPPEAFAHAEPPSPSPAARWMAILLTSLIFASIHRPWFIVLPIFLLSLVLGYIYERTGNLWSSIFMHLLFNTSEFTLFLLAISLAR